MTLRVPPTTDATRLWLRPLSAPATVSLCLEKSVGRTGSVSLRTFVQRGAETRGRYARLATVGWARAGTVLAQHGSSIRPGHQPMTEMIELSREECLQLLKTQTFGRLAVNFGKGPPVIRPVNYAFDEASQSVVFRTADGSKFHALVRSAQAAFEVDRVEGASRTGWSVIVQGVTDEITQPSEVRRLDALGLAPWAPGEKAHWVHIRAWTVSGRRIVVAADGVPRARG